VNILIISSVRFPAGARSFLYSTASRSDLGPAQSLMQWAPEAHSAEVKRPELYIRSPACLHGVVRIT
jgi:hypothetical protein